MSIHNDSEFKAALERLAPDRQRQVAARFARRVADLSQDVRVKTAIEAASRGGVSEAELEVLHQAANSARVESFTRCGMEADWSDQTGHFVAKAAMACVRPTAAAGNLAWDTAMHARMARTCQTITEGTGTGNRETEAQYRLLEDFLNQGVRT